MTVTKKAGIFVLVILLLVAAALIPYFAGRPRFVPTFGKLIYLSDASNPGHQHVWISGPDGEGARELTHGSENDSGPTFSPDGSQIAYISTKSGDPQVWVMDADGQNARPITIATESKSQPEFTPDGASISYITGGDLMLVNIHSHDTETLLPQQQDSATGSSTATLAQEVHSQVVSYAWAPNKAGDESTASLAAVLRLEDDSQELVLLPKLDETQIPLAVGAVISLTWSPDGGRVAGAIMNMAAFNPGPDTTKNLPNGQQLVPAGKGKTPSGVFTFGIDGGIIKTSPPLGLQVGTSMGPQNPQFSADGQTVAFEWWPSTTPTPTKIIGIGQQPADGSSRAMIFLRGPLTNFRWAPDGTHFLFNAPVRNKPDTEDVIVYDTSAHKMTNLTNSKAYATGGEWSLQPAKQKIIRSKTIAPHLTLAQLDDFDSSGYLTFEGLLNDSEIASLKRGVDTLLQRRDGGEFQSWPPQQFVFEIAELGALVVNQSILSIMGDLLGDGFYFHHLHAAKHEAGTGPANWHQDYEQRPQVHRSHRMCHVFFYLNGLNGEVGDLLLIPGSQRSVVDRGAPGIFGTAELPGSIVVDNLAPGSAVVVHSAVWHARRAKPGGEANPRYFID